MVHTIQDVKEELNSNYGNDRFEVKLTDENILRIQSDYFIELPFGEPEGVPDYFIELPLGEPPEVHVIEVDEGRFNVCPVDEGGERVDEGGERVDISFSETIQYIEKITHTNN
jgi:hypothetical protein